MSKWVNLDANFGIPSKQFVVSLGDLKRGLQKHLNLDSVTPGTLELLAIDLLKTHRPELTDVSIAAVGFDFWKKAFVFEVIHASFERTPCGQFPIAVHLKKCPCGEDVFAESAWEEVNGVKFCSEDCAKSWRERPPML